MAREAWAGRRRAEFDDEMGALTRQTAALLEEVRAAIIRVLGASDDAEASRREQLRAAQGGPP